MPGVRPERPKARPDAGPHHPDPLAAGPFPTSKGRNEAANDLISAARLSHRRGQRIPAVMPGLDPGIQKTLDCRGRARQ